MADNTPDSDATSPQPSSHPGFGCAISIIAICIFLSVVGFSIYAFMKQNNAIGEFTQDEIAPTPIAEVSPEAASELRSRLTTYANAAREMEPAEITLTADDLNAMIATIEDLAIYRGLIHFTEIPADGPIKADICFPLRKAKFWEYRYLVGKVEVEVQRIEDNLQLAVSKLEIPDKELPVGFVENFSVMQWLTPFRKDESTGPIFTNSRKISYQEGTLILGVAPPELSTDE